MRRYAETSDSSTSRVSLILFSFFFMLDGGSRSLKSESSSCRGSSFTLPVSSSSLTFLPFLASFYSSSSTDSSLVAFMFWFLLSILMLLPRSTVPMLWPLFDCSMMARSF